MKGKQKSIKNKEKIPRLVALTILRLYDMNANCYPVSENVENKSDLL